MFRRPIRLFLVSLLVLPLTVAVAGDWSPEQVRSMLAERIDEHEKSVGIGFRTARKGTALRGIIAI